MKMNLLKLHVQKIKWRLHGTNALCWTNDNKEIDPNSFQMKHYIIYYNNLVNAYNPTIQARKGLISIIKQMV